MEIRVSILVGICLTVVKFLIETSIFFILQTVTGTQYNVNLRELVIM